MDDLQYLVAMLRDCNYSAVARATGLSDRTIRNIAKEVNTSPSYNTVRILAEYFKGKA